MIDDPFYTILSQQKYQSMFDYLPRYYSNIIEEHKQKEDHERIN